VQYITGDMPENNLELQLEVVVGTLYIVDSIVLIIASKEGGIAYSINRLS
jgi:hypothetical protein